MYKYYVGVEIGASKHQIFLTDEKLNIIKRDLGYVNISEKADGILSWMAGHIPNLINGFDIESISVGFGGIIESSTGKSVVSVQVEGWENFNIKQWFENIFGIKTFVINDTVAGGFAEFYYGTGINTSNFFYTNIGSGIGGVFFLNGSYYDGSGYGAAYFGHTYIPDNSGGFDKVENMCSGFGIQKRLRSPGYIPEESLLYKMCNGNTDTLTTKMLGEAISKGDNFSINELDIIAKAYSIGLSNVITLIHPQVISIGGGVANIGEPLISRITRYTSELVFVSAKNKYNILKSKYGDDAVPLGAISYSIHNHN